ncbi:hypothetical protein EAH72_10340 [Pseudomonas caspiana]|nr:hypothetical protein EAH72_10340 [Pseudomonas caspiana]
MGQPLQALRNPRRSCRRLRSFALDLLGFCKNQDQKIAAFGSSYRGGRVAFSAAESWRGNAAYARRER